MQKCDSKYMIVMQWLNETYQDILFGHTRRLREHRILLNKAVELKKEKRKLKLVREKSPSRKRSVDRPWLFGNKPSPSSGAPGQPHDSGASSYGAAFAWDEAPKHHHPTRLCDVYEEDERSNRTSPSRTGSFDSALE